LPCRATESHARDPAEGLFRQSLGIVLQTRIDGLLRGRRATIRGATHPRSRRSSCRALAVLKPLRPYRSRVEAARTAASLLREARTPAKVADTPRCRCRRVLPTALRLRLADAPPRISALADGLLPLSVNGALTDDCGRSTTGCAQGEVRKAEGRARDLSGALIDGQALKGAGVGRPERGYDGPKRLFGRKRHLLSWTRAGSC